MTQLEKRQVLHPYVCRVFGFETMREILDLISSQGVSTWGESDNGLSLYAEALRLRVGSADTVGPDTFQRYDRNIARVSEGMGMNTAQRSWKPFQYMALLFTEYYLDRYFDNEHALLNDLEKFRIEKALNPSHYKIKDLQTLAFQSATGSGKTLLMHANIAQYIHYMGRSGRLQDLNKIILVTPDERMSNQHLNDFLESGMDAHLFSADQQDMLTGGDMAVEILDIHKLRDHRGDKTVAVDSFEENNLVLVDEGHLSQGNRSNGKELGKQREWRMKLARNGFTFEYSATFNQIADNNEDMSNSYGKSLIFDYSYKHFYSDGYGKDYNIRNLPEESDQTASDEYLLACLLQFYQQRCVYADKADDWQEYNLAPPLMVFLGNTVTAKNKLNAQSQSDVVRIVKFLARVMVDKAASVKAIKVLLSGGSLLIDAKHQQIFKDAFPYIKNRSEKLIYQDMQQKLFNGQGKMCLSFCMAAEEIQIRAGDAKPFGVINVGDSKGLFKLLEDGEDNYRTEKNAFASPLFDEVDYEDSSVTTVIGAQKFVAGWNCWRVSTMGLMNVGRGVGAQIIQMFGRGVRLRGKDMTLKRHRTLGLDEPNLPLLETLNIFGLRANYMEQFKSYLETEGVATAYETLYLPVTSNFGCVKNKGLKIPRLPKELSYETSEDRIQLSAFLSNMDRFKIRKSLYHFLQTIDSEGGQGSSSGGQTSRVSISQFMPHMLDSRKIYDALIQRKHDNNWHNLEIQKADIDVLLDRDEWFELEGPPDAMRDSDLGKRLQNAHILLVDMIEKYCASVYRHNRMQWESARIDLYDLSNNDDNFIGHYEISVPKEDYLVNDVKALIDKLKDDEAFCEKFSLGSLIKNFHGFKPLLYMKKDEDIVNIQPVPLNEGEREFVELISSVDDQESSDYEELFLLRNQARGHGVSFFAGSGNYFPDFIIWLLENQRQHILFVDPKGLGRVTRYEYEKINVHGEIKEYERRLQETHPNVFLHAYIWTATPRDELSLEDTSDENLLKRGIYLNKDGDTGIINMLSNAIGTEKP